MGVKLAQVQRVVDNSWLPLIITRNAGAKVEYNNMSNRELAIQEEVEARSVCFPLPWKGREVARSNHGVVVGISSATMVLIDGLHSYD
jgi:hypothetical protein